MGIRVVRRVEDPEPMEASAQRCYPSRMLRLALACSLLVLTSACAAGSGGPGAASDRSAYPAGPYGTSEGAVLEDLTFVTPAGEPLSLSDIHADPANRLLLISTAAGWCTACIEEQPALEELHAQHQADGLVVLVALFEDRDYQPADAALAEAWQQQHELSFHVVADPEFRLGDYYDTSATPMNMIVDIDTMEILVLQTGWDRAIVESVIEARL